MPAVELPFEPGLDRPNSPLAASNQPAEPAQHDERQDDFSRRRRPHHSRRPRSASKGGGEGLAVRTTVWAMARATTDHRERSTVVMVRGTIRWNARLVPSSTPRAQRGRCGWIVLLQRQRGVVVEQAAV